MTFGIFFCSSGKNRCHARDREPYKFGADGLSQRNKHEPRDNSLTVRTVRFSLNPRSRQTCTERYVTLQTVSKDNRIRTRSMTERKNTSARISLKYVRSTQDEHMQNHVLPNGRDFETHSLSLLKIVFFSPLSIPWFCINFLDCGNLTKNGEFIYLFFI